MSDDLVNRLRDSCYLAFDDGTNDYAAAHKAADRIEELQGRAAAVEAKLAKAVEEKLCATDTLNAWFDRRKLAHEAVDQAVIDAASGYLRTSRVGGMPKKESDLVLGVIKDMARLGMFADLFARAAERKGQTDE